MRYSSSTHLLISGRDDRLVQSRSPEWRERGGKTAGIIPTHSRLSRPIQEPGTISSKTESFETRPEL